MDTNGRMNLCEDYVSFEIAKLLKEKGFDEEIETLITPTGKIYFLDENSVEKTPHKTIRNTQINIYSNDVSCPTLQMTMKYLREVHNISICISHDFIFSDDVLNFDGWFYEIAIISPFKIIKDSENFQTYEEAAEAAIKDCLENSI